MDIQREDLSQQRRRRRILWGGIGVVALALVSLGLSRLKPAAPEVERGGLWLDTVKRGPMVRQVRGPGTLVPVEVRWIAAATEGRVDRLVIEPGTVVKADSVILELKSPEVEQAAAEAATQVRAAEADFLNLRAHLESETLDQEAAAASLEADYNQARLQAQADAELGRQGLVSELTHKLSALKADQLEKRNGIEKTRLTKGAESVAAQLQAQRARLEQLIALAELRRGQLDSLHVRAGIAGVLQQVPVEVGQRVTLGTTLAKVAVPEHLKAQLRIAETQAKDVIAGQKAEIDTRNGIVQGKVVRVDPAVREGTVLVDVGLPTALPQGARPDLSVDGTVELERLDDVLFVGRPTYAQGGGKVGVFRVTKDGKEAQRVSVTLGRSSVATVEVVDGLAEGDQIILSDMAAWDAYDIVRIR